MTHQLLDAAAWRLALEHRSLGRCEMCGQPLCGRWEAHHRQLGTGRFNCLCNGLALHRACHQQAPLAVHANPRQSRDTGRLVSRHAPDPAAVPVLLPRVGTLLAGGWFLLTCDGTYQPYPQAPQRVEVAQPPSLR